MIRGLMVIINASLSSSFFIAVMVVPPARHGRLDSVPAKRLHPAINQTCLPNTSLPSTALLKRRLTFTQPGAPGLCRRYSTLPSEQKEKEQPERTLYFCLGVLLFMKIK